MHLMTLAADPFRVKLPLPGRRAAESLRQQIIDYFLEAKPPVGHPFLSDHQLARAAGLSRPTVRRALDDLSREGWIERRHGRGTFVGPRAAVFADAWSRSSDSTDQSRRVTRLAVLVHGLGDFSHDWYSPSVLAGIDDAAAEQSVSIELVGDRDCDVKGVSARLARSRPDVFACAAPAARHAMLIGESLRQDIPVIGTGSFLMDLGIPTVVEDGIRGAADAVQHLASQGHSRIGFVQMSFSLPLVFQRHLGYQTGLREAGLVDDESLVLWLRRDDRAQQVERFRSYLRRCKPTAILCGSCWPLEFLSDIIRAGDLAVPRDLSVITFDQHPRVAEWLGGVSPTVVALPLRQMGQQLASLARLAAQRQPLEKVTYVPCTLQQGDSVKQYT